MKKAPIQTITIAFFLIFPHVLTAQTDLDQLMKEQDQANKTKEYISATFKGTRLINLHTSEVLGKRVLEFRISHRFAPFNTGINNLYGIEGPANIRLALEYSHNGRLMFGLGRSSAGKLIDVFAKYRILRQTTDNSMPLSVTGIFTTNLTTSTTVINSTFGTDQYDYFVQRLIYTYQLIFARKFSESLSLQVSPILIHYNLVSELMDENNIYSVAFSGRYKVSKRIAVTGEYALRLNHYTENFSSYYNSASVGVDIETGGHVFQLFLTNSYALNEVLVIPYTNTNWSSGGTRIGFNISRAFTTGRKKSAQ